MLMPKAKTKKPLKPSRQGKINMLLTGMFETRNLTIIQDFYDGKDELTVEEIVKYFSERSYDLNIYSQKFAEDLFPNQFISFCLDRGLKLTYTLLILMQKLLMVDSLEFLDRGLPLDGKFYVSQVYAWGCFPHSPKILTGPFGQEDLHALCSLPRIRSPPLKAFLKVSGLKLDSLCIALLCRSQKSITQVLNFALKESGLVLTSSDYLSLLREGGGGWGGGRIRGIVEHWKKSVGFETVHPPAWISQLMALGETDNFWRGTYNGAPSTYKQVVACMKNKLEGKSMLQVPKSKKGRLQRKYLPDFGSDSDSETDSSDF